MQRKKHLYKWLTAMWLLIAGCVLSPATAYPLTPQATTYPGYAARTTTPSLSGNSLPSYQFQSTSSLAPVVGQTSYTSGGYSPMSTSPYRARKNSPWDDPSGDNEIGVTENQMPVGDIPWWIMAGMAALYILIKKNKSKWTKYGIFAS